MPSAICATKRTHRLVRISPFKRQRQNARPVFRRRRVIAEVWEAGVNFDIPDKDLSHHLPLRRCRGQNVNKVETAVRHPARCPPAGR